MVSVTGTRLIKSSSQSSCGFSFCLQLFRSSSVVRKIKNKFQTTPPEWCWKQQYDADNNKLMFSIQQSISKRNPFLFLEINMPQTPRHVWVLREKEANKKPMEACHQNLSAPGAECTWEEQLRERRKDLAWKKLEQKCPEFWDALGKKQISEVFPPKVGEKRCGGVFPSGRADPAGNVYCICRDR